MPLSITERTIFSQLLENRLVEKIEFLLETHSARQKDILDFLAEASYSSMEKHPLLQLLLNQKRFAFVKKLIAAGINVAVPDENGNTPLHVATAMKHHKTMQRLLDADLRNTTNHCRLPITDIRNNLNQTALVIAFESADMTSVNLLMKYNPNIFPDRNHALNSNYPYKKYLEYLLKKSPNIRPYLEMVLPPLKHYMQKNPVNGKVLHQSLNVLASKLIGITKDKSHDFFTTGDWAELFANTLSTIWKFNLDGKPRSFGDSFEHETNFLLLQVRCLLELLLNPIYKDLETELHKTIVEELIIAIESAKMAEHAYLVQEFNGGLHVLARAHEKSIKDKLASLKLNETFSYPGGWACSKTGDEDGHSVYVNFSKTHPQSLKIAVGNTAYGLSKSGKFTTDHNVVAETKTITFGHQELIDLYVEGLTKVTGELHTEKSLPNCKTLVKPSFTFGAYTEEDTKQEPSEYEQLTGNCIVKSYLHSMRLRLSNDAHYRLLYLFNLRVAVIQLNKNPDSKAKLPTLEEIYQYIHCAEAAFQRCTMHSFSKEYGKFFNGLVEGTAGISLTATKLEHKEAPAAALGYSLRSHEALLFSPSKEYAVPVFDDKDIVMKNACHPSLRPG